VDAHYKLITNPHNPVSTDAIVQDSTVFPIVAGPWVANSTTSKWIGPQLVTSASAGGTYVYRLSFEITDRDPASVRIVGTWSTDNPGTEIRVNGVAAANPQSPDFTRFTPFVLANTNASFVAGVNTIDFVVVNAAPGYTGLRVEGLKSDGTPLPPNSPPTITLEPQGRAARETEDVVLQVGALGSAPLTYQWFFEGFDLPDETNSVLRIPNIAPDQAGNYTVTVTNPHGEDTSAAAVITVGPALDLAISKYNRLRIGGNPGTTYRIEFANDPANPVFQTLTNLVLPSDPFFLIDPATNAPHRIYRITPQ
jgi:hypothetical protein